MASTYAGYLADTVLNNDDGSFVANEVVYLFLPDTSTPALTFANRQKTARTYEIRTADDGWFELYADPGFYDIRIGATTRRIKIDEDIDDTLSPDQFGQPFGVPQLDANKRLSIENMPVGYGDSGNSDVTPTENPDVVILANLAGFDMTGATDMWQFLATQMPSWAIQKKKVLIGPGRIALSRGLELYDGTNIEVTCQRPKWMYKGEPPFAFVPAKNSDGSRNFTGSYMARYAQPSLRGGSGDANSCFLKNVVFYGTFTSNQVNGDGTVPYLDADGLVVEGTTYGLVTENCGIRSFNGTALKYKPTVDTDGTGKNSLGHRHVDLGTERIGFCGIDTDGLTDSDIVRHHAHTCGNNSDSADAGSIRLRGAGDFKYSDFRLTFGKRGIITGNSSITQGRPNSHSIKIMGGNSDRMQFGAFEHRAFGTRTWGVKNCTFGRDGRNEAHGTADAVTSDEYGSWAVRVDGGSSQSAAPIIFDGCDIQFGVDDSYPNGVDRNPYTSPACGLIVGRARHVAWNGGSLAGLNHPYHYNANNQDTKVLKISRTTSLITGTIDNPVFNFYEASDTPAA